MIPSESSRFTKAIFVALPVDALLWLAASHAFLQPPPPNLAPIEIQRVVINDKQEIKQIVHKMEDIQKKIQKALPKLPPPVKHELIKPPPRTPPSKPPPEGAHNRVLTSKPTPNGPVEAPKVLPGGNADIGKPTDGQSAGNAKVEPPGPTSPTPPPVQPTPEPVKPTPALAPPPPPPPPPPPVEKPKPEPPKPKGPTKDAEPTNQPYPDIPDDLKSQSFKTFVRVAVNIDESGGFTVTLRTSSGNSEVDKLVLDALKRWKWKPALENGEPVKSTQRFKFEFEVQ